MITWWKRSVCRPLTSSNFLGLHWTLQKEYYERCLCRFCGPRLIHASACHFRVRVICITHAPCELIFLLEIVLPRSIHGMLLRSFLRSFPWSRFDPTLATRSVRTRNDPACTKSDFWRIWRSIGVECQMSFSGPYFLIWIFYHSIRMMTVTWVVMPSFARAQRSK